MTTWCTAAVPVEVLLGSFEMPTLMSALAACGINPAVGEIGMSAYELVRVDACHVMISAWRKVAAGTASRRFIMQGLFINQRIQSSIILKATFGARSGLQTSHWSLKK